MRTPSDDVGSRFRWGLTALLVAIAAWGAFDLVLDAPESPFTVHVLVEVGFIALAMGCVAYLWSGWTRASVRLDQVQRELAEQAAERDLWRGRAEKFLRGLGEEISTQFERWSLTPAEREVALLLLKGFGHREAAELLERSERTVRQHAVAVYRKSGLSGRAALSAFFLEDLLLPNDSSAD